MRPLMTEAAREEFNRSRFHTPRLATKFIASRSVETHLFRGAQSDPLPPTETDVIEVQSRGSG